jgi:small subunit ribosomal protein S5
MAQEDIEEKIAAEDRDTAPPEEKGTKKPLMRNRRVFHRGKRGREKIRSEFDQKIINIRRVTRVVAGGRRFSFSVVLVAGDRKGSVGVGIGKASDTALAV